VPKLFINAEPGAILTGPQRDVYRTWPNPGGGDGSRQPFHPEDAPDDIGVAIANFVRRLRSS
jgi:haloalkane dehalogenase